MSWLSYWPLLLGYPALGLGVLLLGAGIFRRSARLVLFAIVPLLPMGLYVGGSPGYWWIPLSVFIPMILLAWHFRRRGEGAGPDCGERG